MQRKPLSILLVAGVMIPVLGSVAIAQLSPQRDRLGFNRQELGDRSERLIEELDLTDTQVEQIRALRQENQGEMQRLHQNLRTEREALHDLMAGEATEAELRTQHDEIQTRHREIADQRFENMLAVREVLTPEQRAELGQLMEQRRESRRDQFRGHRGDPGSHQGHQRSDTSQ